MEKRYTPEDMELLALRVIDLLTEYDFLEDTCVLANFRRFSVIPHEGARELTTPQGRRVYAGPEPPWEDARYVMPWAYLERMVLTYEGSRLYGEINETGRAHIVEKLNGLLAPFDLYLEHWDSCTSYAAIQEPDPDIMTDDDGSLLEEEDG